MVNVSRIVVSVGCMLCIFSGCDQASPRAKVSNAAMIEGGVAAVDKQEDETSAQAREFFVNWLEDHKEDTIINDDSGVGVGVNKTRLWAFGYGKKGESSEVEFRIVLPDGREIQEFVAGMGDANDDPTSMALVNFCMSTLHPVYSCFMNEADTHMEHQTLNIGGDTFTYTSGGPFVMGSGDLPGFTDVSNQIRDAVSASGMKLSNQAHWMKVVYGQNAGEMILCSVTLDNEPNEMLTTRMGKLNWPEAGDEFYMAKEFIVLRPGDLKSK